MIKDLLIFANNCLQYICGLTKRYKSIYTIIPIIIVFFLIPAFNAQAENIDSLRFAGFGIRYSDISYSLALQHKALTEAYKNKEEKQKIFSYYHLSSTYALAKNVRLMAAYADSTYYGAFALKSDDVIGFGYLAKGVLYQKLRQSSKSVPFLQNAYRSFEKQGNEEYMAIVSSLMANEFSSTNPSRAQKMAKKAVVHAYRQKNLQTIVFARVAYGYTYYMNSIDDSISSNFLYEAIEYYKKTISIIENKSVDISNKNIVIAPFICISILYSRLPYRGGIDSVLFYNDKAKELVMLYPASELYGTVLGVRGEWLLETKKYEEANTLFWEALSYLKTTDPNNNKVIAALYNSLCKIAVAKNNFRAYYQFDTLYRKYDALKNLDVLTKDLEVIHTQYELDTKQNYILRLEKEKDLQDRNRNLRNLIIALLILAVLLLVVIFLFKNKYAQQIAHRLEEENKTSLLALKLEKQQSINLVNENLLLEGKFLQMQMDPHFVYNVMGSLQYYLLKNDNESALKYMDMCAILMRRILLNIRQEKITIAEEMEVLHSYIGLQQMRFANSFNYKLIIAKDINQDTCIPPMLLQPFVENAIEHGLKPLSKTAGGELTVKIELSKDKEQIILIVQDNGVGMCKKKRSLNLEHESIAISVTEQRIKRLSSSSKILIESNTLDQDSMPGTRVIIHIPNNQPSNA